MREVKVWQKKEYQNGIQVAEELEPTKVVAAAKQHAAPANAVAAAEEDNSRNL